MRDNLDRVARVWILSVLGPSRQRCVCRIFPKLPSRDIDGPVPANLGELERAYPAHSLPHSCRSSLHPPLLPLYPEMAVRALGLVVLGTSGWTEVPWAPLQFVNSQPPLLGVVTFSPNVGIFFAAREVWFSSVRVAGDIGLLDVHSAMGLSTALQLALPLLLELPAWVCASALRCVSS